jgi:hypothetical protein
VCVRVLNFEMTRPRAWTAVVSKRSPHRCQTAGMEQESVFVTLCSPKNGDWGWTLQSAVTSLQVDWRVVVW